MGWNNIRYRAEFNKGSLGINTEHAKGTSVLIELVV
jgi:signal transduction histidine kinase